MRRRSAGGRPRLAGLGEHRLEVCPLDLGEAGFVSGDFHHPTGDAANESRKTSQSNQTFCSFICQLRPHKYPGSLFQTCSEVCLCSRVGEPEEDTAAGQADRENKLIGEN
jgi:hypothetical protein